MKSTVYFSRTITPDAVLRLYKLVGKELPGKVAVKVHSGEKGNQNFLHPDFWKEIIDYVGGNVHRDFLPVSRKAYPYGDGNQCQGDKAELPHPPPEGRGVGLNFLLLLLLLFDDVLGLLSGSGHRRLAVKEPGQEQKHSHH